MKEAGIKDKTVNQWIFCCEFTGELLDARE
jgi:hypothetical protein